MNRKQKEGFLTALPTMSIGKLAKELKIQYKTVWVLLWIPTHGRAKAGRPARMYIQQLCEDTGCCPEDLPRR